MIFATKIIGHRVFDTKTERSDPYQRHRVKGKPLWTNISISAKNLAALNFFVCRVSRGLSPRAHEVVLAIVLVYCSKILEEFQAKEKIATPCAHRLKVPFFPVERKKTESLKLLD